MPRKYKRAYDSPPIAPAELDVFFETNGAENPTVLSGQLESVTRLTSDGGNAFYRLRRFNVFSERRFRYISSASIEANFEASDDLVAQLPKDLALPVSATPIKANEFDVVILSAGTPNNSIAAGRRVGIRILFEEHQTI